MPVYYDLQHLLIFNTEGLSQGVIIKVFDEQPGKRNREPIFQAGTDEKQVIFETPDDFKARKLFIEYIVPPVDTETPEMTERGCAVFMMGYIDEAFQDLAKEATSK